MKTAGIIAEYNPFHNGHAHHIEQTRRSGCTHIVVVMSGLLTQRGEFACMPKAARAEAALRCGADLVLELPLPWACASAETFAAGGVGVLNALGNVDTLSFGSESGDAALLQKTAARLLELNGTEPLRQALAAGVSFPRARMAAYAELFPGAELSPLRHPNDTLGVEYCKALLRSGSGINPFTVARRGAEHDAGTPSGQFASATFLRGLLESGRMDEAAGYMPEAASAILRREQQAGRAPFQRAALEPLVLAQLRRMSAADFARLPDVSEGLENRLAAEAAVSSGLEELYARVKTRRYPLSRIRRIVACAFLGIPREAAASSPPYIRVLGLNARGAELLAAARKTAALPIITRYADTAALSEPARRVYAAECLAADLYGLCLPVRQACGTEQKYTPRFLTPVENFTALR